MSREIKFRAFIKKLKRIYPVVSIGLDRTWITVNQNGLYRTYKFEKAILMQYTGLKDKNGVEIYEGDVVKCVVNKKDFDVGVVDWDYECPGWVVKKHPKAYHHITGLWDRSVEGYSDSIEPTFHKDRRNKNKEVIGNIYESPERLEATHE